MVDSKANHATYALIEFRPEFDQLQASYVWSVSSHDPDATLHNTYTIPLGTTVSLELDSEFPIRPVKAVVREAQARPRADLLAPYLGLHVVESMLDAAQGESLALVAADLSDKNRFAIARLQLSSPSTPPRVRIACQCIWDGRTI